MELTKLGRIGVLMGGPSSEREISLKSGKAVYESLAQSGLDVAAVDIKTDAIQENKNLIKSQNINCVFIALHGQFGEDGQIQRVLDTLKIPYTGSGAMSSKLAIDKIASREIFKLNGLHTPEYIALNKGYYTKSPKNYERLTFPLVVKPATHGSSIGLSIVDKQEDIDKAIGVAFSFDENILIEQYIKGREMTVAIFDEKALPVIEIVPKKRFFDYEAKYEPGKAEYRVPAQLEPGIARQIQEAALSAHRLLDCFGFSRVDLILDENNTPFILEINTIPGLTQTSLLPKAAKLAGIEFNQLCIRLIQLAYEKAAKTMEVSR